MGSAGCQVDHHPSENSSLGPGIGWNLAGNAAHAGCQWGVVLMFARFGGAEMLGRYALGLAIAAPVMAIAMLHLRSMLATDAKQEFLFHEYLSARLLMACLGAIAIAGIGFAGSGTGASVVALVGILKAADSASEIFRGLYQQQERMDISGQSLGLKGFATLAMAGGALILDYDIEITVLAMIAGSVATTAIFDVPWSLYILRTPRKADAAPIASRRDESTVTKLVRLVRRALPLGVGMFFLALHWNIPRYLLEQHHGEVALGYFVAMASLVGAGSILVTSFGQTIAPRLSQAFHTSPSQFHRTAFRHIKLSAGLGLLGVTLAQVAGDLVLELLYGVDYAQFHREFVLIVIAGGIGFVGSACGTTLTATRSYIHQLRVGVAAFVAALVTSLILVPTHAMSGAIWSLISAECVTALWFGIAVLRLGGTRIRATP